MTEAPVLKYFEPAEELILKRDASDTGLGVVLTRNGQPIAFASRALYDAEIRYTQKEKEFLAVVFSLETFHQYTYGCPLTVQSDHKPPEVIIKKLMHRVPKRLYRKLCASRKRMPLLAKYEQLGETLFSIAKFASTVCR